MKTASIPAKSGTTRKVIKLVELKALCDAYDVANGQWPESPYEGNAVYKYVAEALLGGKKLEVKK